MSDTLEQEVARTVVAALLAAALASVAQAVTSVTVCLRAVGGAPALVSRKGGGLYRARVSRRSTVGELLRQLQTRLGGDAPLPLLLFVDGFVPQSYQTWSELHDLFAPNGGAELTVVYSVKEMWG